MVRSGQPKKKTAPNGDSDSECDIQPSQVPFFTPTRTARKNPVATDKDAVSTDSSDSEEAGLSKQVQAKRSPGKSILVKGTTIKPNQALHSKTADTNQVTAPEKTGSSTDSEGTSDSDSSTEAPAKGIPVKTRLSVSAKTTPAPKTPATGKKAKSSDTESSDDSDSEEEAVAKTVLSKAAPINPAKSSLMTPTKATPTLKTPAVGKKDVMSDSGSSEDSDSEEEAPVKAVLAKGTPSKLNFAKPSQGTPTKAATATKVLICY
ncbi:nucleolar protein dao-5-like [Brienomyrus brachyistius]|uniref:nucleolar protein dao-5-like n=1 Tax=Brienomyrus brachyistius TaxID=42636 RepID=UPI0020B1E5B5|nr:nucleolar protein dao-5-like [Brienomyrus brachyistius]